MSDITDQIKDGCGSSSSIKLTASPFTNIVKQEALNNDMPATVSSDTTHTRENHIVVFLFLSVVPLFTRTGFVPGRCRPDNPYLGPRSPLNIRDRRHISSVDVFARQFRGENISFVRVLVTTLYHFSMLVPRLILRFCSPFVCCCTMPTFRTENGA